MDPLLEETLAATAALTALGVVLAAFFWLVAGDVPLTGIILGELIGLAMGIPLLALTSPRRRR